MNSLFLELLPELIATLVGVVVGTFVAIRIDRVAAHNKKLQRKQVTLLNIKQELEQNYTTVSMVLDDYKNTPYGKGIYVSTIAWETSVTHGDLQEIIGTELSDIIENQYSRYLSLRYYVDLLTTLWFSPKEIDGYQEIRREFRRKIIVIIEDVIQSQDSIITAINNNID